MSDVFENVMDLAKRRGFIWPTSECYGAVAGFIDYGPLGAMMKRRIENIWRHFYVVQEGYYEIECPTIAQEAVFIASGHVKGFLRQDVPVPALQGIPAGRPRGRWRRGVRGSDDG